MGITTEYVAFSSRARRSDFVARRFADYLNGSILDVGCDQAPLRDMFRSNYTGIDIAGKPDIKIDLEKIQYLPFKDNSFNCVLCIDVLEHLENLESIFAELMRVSDQYIIISLPNCWRDARRPIEKGMGYFKHYGLPNIKLRDRHKWFFSLTQARVFIEAKAQEFHLTLVNMLITEKPKKLLIRLFRKIRYHGQAYHNRYSQTLWAIFQKQ